MLYFLSSKTTIVLHRLKHAYYLPISQVKSMWWKYSNMYRCLVVLRYSITSLILPDLNVDPSFCSTVVQLADLHGGISSAESYDDTSYAAENRQSATS